MLSMSSFPMKHHRCFFLSLLVLVSAYLATADASKTNDTNDGSNRFIEEIQCYTLPYGGLGFLSHLLTYYTITVQCLGKRPLVPWSDLAYTGRPWNVSLVVIKLFMTVIPCIYTMARCSHDWEFEVLAAMKLGLSITSVLIALIPVKEWGLFHVLASIPGTVGTIFLAASYFNGAMKIVTAVFTGAGFLFLLGVLAWGVEHYGTSLAGVFVVLLTAAFGFMPLLGALWSDWVLAVIADNTVGYPYRANNAGKTLWIIYWVGKRIGLLMM